MKRKLIPLATAAFVAASGLGFAQDFAYVPDAPYPNDSFRDSIGFQVDDVSFNNDTGNGLSNPWNFGPLGARTSLVTFGSGVEVEVLDICAQLFVGPDDREAGYFVSEGFSSSLDPKADSIRALLSNAVPLLLAQTDYDSQAIFSSAIQLAFWEIAEETHTSFSLDENSTDRGVLSVNLAGTTAGATVAAVDLAEIWLANVNSSIWNDEGGLRYYYADSAAGQDRLWIAPIPEPSTALLGGLGALFLLRRRRN